MSYLKSPFLVSFALTVLGVVLHDSTAVAQVHIVAPNLPVVGEGSNGMQYQDGNGNLLTGTAAFRVHQMYPSSNFDAVPAGGAWIVAFADRADESQQEEITLNYDHVNITLSTMAADNLSSTFADNIGNDAMTVIDGPRDVTYTVASSGPNEFSGIWEFDAPFFYDPQQGNLLVDFASNSGAASFNLDVQNVDYVADVGGSGETATSENRTSILEQFVFVDESQLCIPLQGNFLPLEADLDLDGEVSFSDFLILSANFGAAGTYIDGDIDCSESVGFADFLALSANFGTTSIASAVPEPAGVALALFGSIAMLTVTRRPQRQRS